MAGVIEWFYKDVFQARRSYKHRQDRKEIMSMYLKIVGVSNRHKMYFIIRPNVSISRVIELEKRQLNE
jgi:hypothetical protein